MSNSSYKSLLRNLPRVNLQNLKANPYAEVKHSPNRGPHAIGLKNGVRPNIKPRIGYVQDKTPFQKRIPKYGYNREQHLKRQYFPLTLWQLQRHVDLGRIDPTKPVDITAISNGRVLSMVGSESNYYGIYLLEQGANIFKAKLDIEVQIVDELALATVEKAGGTVSTAFYDRRSFVALCNPVEYFLMGKPIHKRLLPPQELVTYYTDPKVRGYLSDPAKIWEERMKLAKKYGYDLPELSEEQKHLMVEGKKDPRQVFNGLMPGSIVNLADKTVLVPENEHFKQHAAM
nr:39S ribosomal protein L15, mitochondrial [Ciona intestinalis]|eukprot:XP_026696560.1 39S ribosomal protein L15, mitochondrial [Ciona intestinalis]